MLDKLLKKGGWPAVSVVFSVSLAVRLFFDSLFQLRFGYHAANHLEIWLYTGVMEGTKLTGGGWDDPVVWILRAIGHLVPAGYAFYAVMASSAVFSSLTAVAIFLLANELYDGKTGFSAGMVYGAMVEPIALSMSGFTHDHVQLLIMVASMLFAVKAAKSGLKGGIIWSCAYVLVVEAGKRINYSINLIVGLTLLYVGYTTLDYLLERMFGRSARFLYPVYVSIVVLGLFAFGRTVLPPLVEGNLDLLPQGRMGSADILPVNLLTLWLRYNVLLFLLPFGVIAAYGRKDIFGIALTLIGFMLAGIMDRGTRIGDIGVAMVVAYALIDWGQGVRRKVVESEAAKVGYLSAAVFLSIIVRLSVDYALENDASLPKTPGWDFGQSFYIILMASAAMAYLFWAKVRNVGRTRNKADHYPLKNGLKRLLSPLTGRSIWVSATAAILLAGAFPESVVSSIGMVYKLVSFFAASALPVSLSLLSSAALPAVASAYLCLLLIERYMRRSWWGSNHALIFLALLFMSLTTMFTVATLRMSGAKAVGADYLLVFMTAGLASLFIGFRELRTKAVWASSALIFAYVANDTLTGHYVAPEYATVLKGYMLIFLAAGAALLHIVTRLPDRVLPAVATVLLLSIAVNIHHVYTVESRKVGSDKEYEILKWLADNNNGGKILTPWDHGYLAEVVSGLDAVSTPGIIDNRTHSFLWMPERQAALNFNNKGVRYIFLTDETFNMVRDQDGQLMYRLMGGLVFRPKEVPLADAANRYTLYKLRHNLTEGYFRLLKSEKDPVTGMGFLLYEVAGEPASRVGNLSLIGGVAYNAGGNKTVRMLVSKTEINETYNRTYYPVGEESFREGELKDVLYAVEGLDRWDCGLRPAPEGNRLWDYTGSLVYVNTGPERDVMVSANLVTQGGGEVVGTFGKTEHFMSGQKKTVPLVFHDVDEWGEYAVDLVQGGGMSLVGNETPDPKLENVKMLAVFC